MAAMEAAADAMLAAASRAFTSTFAIAIQIQVRPRPLPFALWTPGRNCLGAAESAMVLRNSFGHQGFFFRFCSEFSHKLEVTESFVTAQLFYGCWKVLQWISQLTVLVE